MQKGMKNTGLLSTRFNGECYRNDQREEKKNDKGNRKEEDKERKWDRMHKEKRSGR